MSKAYQFKLGVKVESMTRHKSLISNLPVLAISLRRT
jgi:hypothetical protein